jgi:ATP-dependent RNA helicase RhlE
MSFSKLGLAPALCAPLDRMGYKEPTPIQATSIPHVLSGIDLVARAQTGTGKTAAFGLPMIERLVLHRQRATTRKPLGLVLVPTRELAAQVHDALMRYGASVQLRVTAIFGGVSMVPQVKALTRGADIVVATPGRLIDHLQRRTIDLSAIEILVLDEADRMLDMGFLPPLRRVLPALPRTRQTLLFSATLSAEVERLSGEFTRDARRVDVSNRNIVAPTVTHRVHPVALDRKRDLLVHVLTQAPAGQALVFCKTKRGADRVGRHLVSAGLRAGVIHGNKSQGARSRSLADFKAGHVTVLVATDIAARGLDIAQLPLVVNYDLPLVAEDYVHRVGRTGRAGADGRAISLITALDDQLLRDIQRLLPAPLERVVTAGFETAHGPASPSTPQGDRHPSGRDRFRSTRTHHLSPRSGRPAPSRAHRSDSRSAIR